MAEATNKRAEPRTVSRSHSELIRWMSIQDANSAGFVHGGVVMRMCDEAAGIADPAAAPDQQMLAAGLKGALECTLARMPAQQRACWILRELEGMSYEEAADVLGTTPAAVRGRLYRARAGKASDFGRSLSRSARP